MFDPILLLLLAMLAASVYLAWTVIKAAKPKRLPPQPRYWGEIQKARQTRDLRNKKLSKINRKSLSHSGLSRNREWNQLLIRVKSDIPTAERLVNSLKLRHPDKSDRWLIEKAIYDLERDNRR